MTTLERHLPAGLAGVTSLVVLYGGRSSEREVSLTSGRAVLNALRGLETDRERPRIHAVEIAADGRWLVEGRAFEACEAVRALPADAVFFLGLHGGSGEDGTIQAFLETCGRRYTGSGVAASSLCMNKHLTRLALAAGGLRVAPGTLVLPEAWREDRAAELERIAALRASALFVKPNRGGSSVGTTRSAPGAEIVAAIDRVLSLGDAALVEGRVEGVEATCAVLGNRGDELRALPPVEIRPRAAGFFDYREKYDEAGAEELCPPRSLSPAACERVATIAARAHRLAGCDGYSRTDFIVPREGGGAGEPVVLEINTLPGLTPRSLSPRAAAAAGMDFRAFCLEIVRLAVATDRSRAR